MATTTISHLTRSQLTLKSHTKHEVVFHPVMSRFSLTLQRIQHLHLDQPLETRIGS